MPSIQQTDKGGFLTLDDDRVSMKVVPLNFVIFNIKQDIRKIRLMVSQGSNQSNIQFAELVELFEEEIDPYIDDLYKSDLEQAEKDLKEVLMKQLKYSEDAIKEDKDGSIAVERNKVRYRLLNALLCRKNIYPARTFIDSVDPI